MKLIQMQGKLNGIHPLTPMSDQWVTKTEFLLTVKIQHQADEWWE